MQYFTWWWEIHDVAAFRPSRGLGRDARRLSPRHGSCEATSFGSACLPHISWDQTLVAAENRRGDEQASQFDLPVVGPTAPQRDATARRHCGKDCDEGDLGSNPGTAWDKVATEAILPRDRVRTKDVYLMRVMGCSA